MVSSLRAIAMIMCLFVLLPAAIRSEEKNQELPVSIASQEKIQERYQQLEAELAQVCYKLPQFEAGEPQSLRNVLNNLLPQKLNVEKLNYNDALPGYDKVALVSMVKDEQGVIFENLCWHYFMGFRKFIIIDNGSTDNTPKLIELFKELTVNTATVIKIDDSRVLYLQTSRMNALIRLAEELFPEITWVFPNDADEFFISVKSLESALTAVPSEVNCIYSPRVIYIPSDDYFDYTDDKTFCKRLHVAHKKNPYGLHDNSCWNGKSFIRAHQGLMVVRGNHYASNTSVTKPNYMSAIDCGLHIREYPLRSPEHALKKIINCGFSKQKLNEKYTPVGSSHVDLRYERYLKYGDVVGMQEFKQFMTQGGCSFDERMPLELAVKALVPSGSAYEFSYKWMAEV